MTPGTDGATSAPSPRNRCNGSGDRSNAVTRAPLFLTMLRQIGSPITPSPMKPTVLNADITRTYLAKERDGA